MKLYPDDWRVRLTHGVVMLACVAAAWMLGPMVGINMKGFWPLMVTIFIAMGIAWLVCRLVFRPSSGGPPDHRPQV